MIQEEKNEFQITKKERNNFLFGLSGQNIVYGLIGGSFFTYFLTDIALFPAIAVSILLIVGKLWDGINDPVVGSIVDKHTFKNGEKLRPLLKFTPIPVGIFTVLMFVVFPGSDKLLWLRISYFVIMYLCWDIVYTMQDVGIWGITALITRNSLERDYIVKWARTVGSCVFGIASAIIPMALEIFVNSTGMSWQLATVVFAIIFGFGGALMSGKAAKAKERVPKQLTQGSMKESFSLLFKNKILLLLCLGNLLGSLAIG
ncbi:MAG: MFS transporter, partial [Clostridia bacterium]